jgi:hypothetical protein
MAVVSLPDHIGAAPMLPGFAQAGNAGGRMSKVTSS